MRFYQYSVSDKQGRQVDGTLQAASSDAARLALSNAGFTIFQIQELQTATQAKAVPQRPPPPHPTPPRPSPQQQRQIPINQAASTPRVGRPEMSAPVHLNSISSGAPRTDTVKTKNGDDKDLFFLFSQLGSYFRSGINPVQALNDLIRRTPTKYHAALQEAAHRVAEGGRMSEAFDRYPYLFPPDVVGTVRAGEVAGFLPEAMDEIGSKMELSYRMKRRLKYFWWMFIATVAITPLILATVQGSLKSMEVQDAAGGSLSPVGTLGTQVGISIWHDLPITLLLFGGLWGILAWLNSMPMRRFRHIAVIRTPVLGKRAMAESMARLSWALSMVSRGGLSPQNTFILASESVPNLYVRERLTQQGSVMKESDKLSSALRQSEMLPPEFGDIVETGEVTGDVPRALEHVAKASDADFQARNATAVTSSSWILYGLFGILILVLCAWLLRAFYGGLIGSKMWDS